MNKNYDTENMSNKQLIDLASKLLAESGSQWDGRPKLKGSEGNEQYQQSRFDRKIQTGAYSANSRRK
tara:strand:+ start:1612 stop:1812 length:201 start_codon:yes stop_codon:yes gene_type:complete